MLSGSKAFTVYRIGRKSFIPKGVISLDPTVKVILNYLVPFGDVLFSSATSLKVTRGPQTRIRPRLLAVPECPSLAQNFQPVELTQA